jgi:hypothetical protein
MFEVTMAVPARQPRSCEGWFGSREVGKPRVKAHVPTLPGAVLQKLDACQLMSTQSPQHCVGDLPLSSTLMLPCAVLQRLDAYRLTFAYA